MTFPNEGASREPSTGKYIYIAGAQHNVTISDNGRTRNWTGSTAREELGGKTEEEAEEAEDIGVFLMR